MAGFDAALGEPHPPATASPAYRDPHETSLTLILLGTAIVVPMTALLAGGGSGPAADWPSAVLLTVAFVVLWLTFRRRAAVHGVSRPRGFGIAAIIGLVLLLPAFLLAPFYPFVVFGFGLMVAGGNCDNPMLLGWGTAGGGIGAFAGFLGITYGLRASLLLGWERPAIYLFLGLLTLVAGIIFRLRENRACARRPSENLR
jgi:hypothetical protein